MVGKGTNSSNQPCNIGHDLSRVQDQKAVCSETGSYSSQFHRIRNGIVFERIQER